MADTFGKRRVFFALWPDAVAATAIDANANGVVRNGRRVPQSQVHLTLAFVGAVEHQTVTRLLEEVNNIAVPAFALRLDQIGYFQRLGIVWLGPSQAPAELQALADAVARIAGLNMQHRQFRPHVSLARGASAPGSRWRVEPVVWSVRSFCLVESGASGAPGDYHCLRRWQLL